MKAIVCVNNNWAIGKNGDLLYSLPGDMKFFRETTKGKTVIMGRKTLNSFPNGNPLKNRVNIVISSNPDEKEGVVWVKTPFEALEKTSGRKACISLEPFSAFYTAEEEHQDYYLKHPEEFEQELIESGRKKK